MSSLEQKLGKAIVVTAIAAASLGLYNAYQNHHTTVQKNIENRTEISQGLENAIYTDLMEVKDSYNSLKTFENNPISNIGGISPHLDNYDFLHVKLANYFSEMHDIPNDVYNATIMKSISIEESGTTLPAWEHDPMQVFNLGDYAKSEIGEGDEGTHFFTDEAIRNLMNEIPHTEYKNGNWDYSDSTIDPFWSIVGGHIWYLRKAANFGKIETSGILEYEVRSGDTAISLANELNAYVSSFEKYNRKFDRDELSIGQILKYKETEFGIIGWKSSNAAIRGYNGGGNRNYLREVNEIRNVDD